MKPTRMTSNLRRTIRDETVHQIFEPRLRELRAREDALAVVCRDSALGKHRDTFLSLPENLVHTDPYIEVVTPEGYVHDLYFWDEDFREHTCRPTVRGRVNVKGTVARNVHAWAEDQSQIEKDMKALRGQLISLLDSVSNSKQLLELWPDGKPYVEPILARRQPERAMISVDALNELIQRVA